MHGTFAATAGSAGAAQPVSGCPVSVCADVVLEPRCFGVGVKCKVRAQHLEATGELIITCCNDMCTGRHCGFLGGAAHATPAPGGTGPASRAELSWASVSHAACASPATPSPRPARMPRGKCLSGTPVHRPALVAGCRGPSAAAGGGGVHTIRTAVPATGERRRHTLQVTTAARREKIEE